MIWPIVAVIMAFLLWKHRGSTLSAPRGFGLWIGFLVALLLSALALDTFGRFVGYGYRASLYLAATVIFLYVYNARSELTPRYVAGVLTSFWAVMTVGGIAGLVAPLFSVRTPLAYLLPNALLSNELVQEMVFRRVTQYNPDAWAPLFPRPSAPFLYTNGWGFAFAMLLPVVLAYLTMIRGTARFWWVALGIPVSLVPAVLSLNRGMFIGLGVAFAFVLLRLVLAGRIRAVVQLAAVAVIGLVVALQTPLEERLTVRLDTSATTDDRATLYLETLQRTLSSPIIGYGAPRPSVVEGLPSVGTQGHVWMLMFSHGLPALALFVAFFVVVLLRARPGRGPVHLAATAGLLAGLTLCAVYTIANTCLILMMVTAAIIIRPETEVGAAGEPASAESSGGEAGARRGARIPDERGGSRGAGRPTRSRRAPPDARLDH